MRRPALTTLACGLAGLGLVAGAFTGPAAAAPAAGPVTNPSLKLIDKSQVAVKQGVYGPWSHTPVIKGQYVQNECATLAFPKQGTLHRAVFNDDQGNAIRQYAVRMPSVAAAKKLTAKVEYCFSKARSERVNAGVPGFEITYRNWGDFKVEEGLLVRSQYEKQKGYPGRAVMSAVGRDGRVVMGMWWTLYDTSSFGPRTLWTGLSKKALNQIR